MILRLFSLACLCITLALFTGCSNAVGRANDGAPSGTGFLVKKLPNERRYGVFVPRNYDPGKPYPVILFLHGGFENGSDPDKAFSVGLGPVVADRAANFEYIAIFPQARGSWRDDHETDDAYTALQEVRRSYRVDNSRVILTGLSWGGYGVWTLAEQHPSEFAAIVPMCANEKPDAVPAIRGIPTWCFHNALDPFVSCGDSKNMVNLINEAGGKAKITTYGAFGHDVWVRAYKEPELWTWLAQQRKAGAAPSIVPGPAASGRVMPNRRPPTVPIRQVVPQMAAVLPEAGVVRARSKTRGVASASPLKPVANSPSRLASAGEWP